MSSPETAFAARLAAATHSRDNWVQLAKFALIGGSGYLINLGVFALLADEAGIAHQVAAVAAFGVAVVSNFFWNRRWTFRPDSGAAGFQAARFFAVSVAAFLFSLAMLELLVGGLGVQKVLAQAIAIVAATPLNFLGNKLWSFRA
jgi:dolichol-phosphate mannosyltransferase